MRATPPAQGRRRLSRPAQLTLAFLGASGAVGLAATLHVLLGVDPVLRVPGAAVLAAGLAVAAGTVGNLLLRFVRWQYVLRRLEVRLPAPASLGAFTGSFALLPVPLYLGQLVARVRLGAPAGVGLRGSLVLAFLWERALDVWVLALLALPALSRRAALALAGVLVVAVLPPVRGAFLRAARAATDVVLNEPPALRDARVARATGGSVLVVSVLLSLAAWGLTAVSLVPLAWAAGLWAEPAAVAAAAAHAILVGGVSLVPLGVGVSGLLLVDRLGALGAEPAAAAQVVFVFRAATVWLTVGLGAVALLVLLRRRSRQREARDRFDRIDECYDAWLPLAYRAHVVAKKTAPMLERLGAIGPGARGLDIGCGRGWYLREMGSGGARMTGIDTSSRQLGAARGHLGGDVALVQGSVLGLPLRAASFDFAYVINVLHHLPSPADQRRALGEIGRVVRPGGLVFVHEMNVVNPLFRFYLGYVFPVLKGIDEGTEPFLDARRLESGEGLRLAEVRFFTFVPDFVPRGLLRWLAPLERRLEAGRLARYGAHFMAVYERTDAAALAPGPGSR